MNTLVVIITLVTVLQSNYAYSQVDLTVKLDSFLKKSKSVQSVTLPAEKVFTANDLILNIPKENSPNSPVTLGENKPVIPEKKILISPKITKIPKITLQPLLPAKVIFSTQQVIPAPPVAPLAPIQNPEIKSAEAVSENGIDISPDEYKIIQGLIFYELQKKYDVAMSLFVELAESSQYKLQALLHYAESAYSLGLFAEYRQNIFQLIDKTQDKSLKTKAVQSLVKNINAVEPAHMGKVDDLVKSFSIDIRKNDAYLYKLANYLLKEGNLSAAESALVQIGPKSDFYPDSVLLLASLNYRKGELTKAIDKLEKEIAASENKFDKKDTTRNMLILTLARFYFQKGQYKKSYESYLKIDRSSPLWIQSVVEQAWAQILVGDHIGAAGNMFSLHTEVFKKMYLPESYIVRSVGYLNLCQYGDALHVLTDLDRRYKQTYEKLVKFQTENKNTLPYYDLVKTWFTNARQAEINSIPRSFIAELAVHPSFTNIQKQMNNYEEEKFKFNKIVTDFLSKEHFIKQRIANLKNEVKTLKNQKVSIEILQENQLKSDTAEVELNIVKRGHEGLKKVYTTAANRFEGEKSILKNAASQVLKTRYGDTVEALGKLLEQEEVLAYEIYSGAGEHIRYQLAGGKTDDRAPASLTPEEKKSYKWKFRGEVWEDEIGHYRSSLKNVCASDELAKKGEQ